MTLRRAIRLGLYFSLVPLVSAAGAGRPSAAAAFGAVEAPAADATLQGAATGDRGRADLPVRSTRLERHDASTGLAGAVRAMAGHEAAPLFFSWTVPVVERARHEDDRRHWNGEDGHACTVGADDRIRPQRPPDGARPSPRRAARLETHSRRRCRRRARRRASRRKSVRRVA
jgi:hypothetical protein